MNIKTVDFKDEGALHDTLTRPEAADVRAELVARIKAGDRLVVRVPGEADRALQLVSTVRPETTATPEGDMLVLIPFRA